MTTSEEARRAVAPRVEPGPSLRAFSSDQFVLPLPDGHRFPMRKYRMLREEVERSDLVPALELREPEPVSEDSILRVHTDRYWRAVRDGLLGRRAQRALGFPWSSAMVERSRRSVGATLGAARWALDRPAGEGLRCGINLAGGTHHAFADRGGGFCVLNDVAVTVRALQAVGRLRRAVIIDCDVHQGDGTAAIFADDPTCFTLSLHGRRNYPFHKQRSDLDVPLEDDCGDAEYLAALDAALGEVEERFAPRQGDVAFYLAGADPFVGDRLGRLALSKEGLRCRDHAVLAWCARLDLPTVVTMAGGYAERIEDVVEIHAGTVQVAWTLADGRNRGQDSSP